MSIRAPKGLSTSSTAVWNDLTQQHQWASHELLVFERALKWFDRSDALAAAADHEEGREAAALLKASMDASTSGLRFWRTLKFGTGEAARRPGRPSGDDWSKQRKLASIEARREAIS